MRITVTGAAGRIGSAVCRRLVEEGHAVVATDVSSRKDLPVPLEIANLLDRTACYRLLEGSDAVVHMGNHPNIASRAPAVVYGENCVMTANVFHAAHELGVRKWVYASSIQAMRGVRQLGFRDGPSCLVYLPADGQMPQNASNLYGLSKVAGEQLLKHYAEHEGHSAVAIRFPWVVDLGPSPREKLPIDQPHAYPDEMFSFLDLRDAASLVAAILSSAISGYRCYLPASNENLPQRPVAELIREHFASVPLRRPVQEIHSLIDTHEIERDTGWRAVV